MGLLDGELTNNDVPDINPSSNSTLLSTDTPIQPNPVVTSQTPDWYATEERHLALMQAERESQSDLTAAITTSLENYNSVASYFSKNEGQDVYGYSDEEIDEHDDTFKLNNHPELRAGLPLHYRRELATARNYKHALVMRYRMMSRMQNQEFLMDAGLGYQLLGGIVAAGLDPLSWLGGGIIGAAGKGALRANQIRRLHESIRQGTRLTRTGYAVARGSAYGAGGAAAQFGGMSLYDPSVTPTVIQQELQAGAVGGAVLPIVGGVIGGSLGAASNRLIRADLFDDFVGPRPDNRVGPVGRIVQWTGGFGKNTERAIDLVNVPGWIAGRNPYQIHQRHNVESAGQIFESGRGPKDGSLKRTSAELLQSRHLRLLTQEADYNGLLEEYVGTQIKAWRVYKKSRATWTHSQAKQDFESRVLPLLYQIEEGSALPDTASMTGTVKAAQEILNKAATQFHEVFKKSMKQMADAGVDGAKEMYDAGIYIPKTINEHRIHNLIVMRTNRALDEHIQESGNPTVSDAQRILYRQEAERSITENLSTLINRGIKADLEGGAGPDTVIGKMLNNVEGIVGRELEDFEISRLQRAITRGLSEGTMTAALRSSRSNPFDMTTEMNKALGNALDFTYIDDIAAGHTIINPALALDFKNAVIAGVLTPGTPYNTTLLHKYLRSYSDNIATVRDGSDRWDLNLFKSLFDDDLFGTLSTAFRERTGQSAIARTVEMPDELGNNIPGQMITNPKLWEDASEFWRNKGATVHEEYPIEFWEDTWRSFVGEPTRHMVQKGIGASGRRITTAAYQSSLGLAGLSQLADVSTVMAMGIHGKLAASETFVSGMISPIRRMFRMNGTPETLRELETLLGSFGDEFRYKRGDFYKAEFIDRDTNLLRNIIDPGKVFNRNRVGNLVRDAGDGIDNIQAHSDRVLGTISGMNTATHYLAVAGQKALIKEFDRFVRKLDTDDFSKIDIGWMRRLGITRLKKEDPIISARMARDSGDSLNPHQEYINNLSLEELKVQWETHIERGPFGGVKKLNIDQWDPIVLDQFTNAMERGMGFLMGTATRGELPRRLDNPFIAAILQIRRYSMGSHEKALQGGLNIGAGHLFHHALLGTGIGMAVVLMREFIKGGPQGVEDKINQDNYTLFRNALSTSPTGGSFFDTSSMVLAPLASFAAVPLGEFWETDWPNMLHFGYNRYNYGPARGGLDAMMEQIPAYKWTSDGMEAGANFFINYDDDNNFRQFLFDMGKVMPAPLGNSMGSIVLNNLFELDEDKLWEN